jgi:hypothetical protein
MHGIHPQQPRWGPPPVPRSQLWRTQAAVRLLHALYHHLNIVGCRQALLVPAIGTDDPSFPDLLVIDPDEVVVPRWEEITIPLLAVDILDLDGQGPRRGLPRRRALVDRALEHWVVDPVNHCVTVRRASDRSVRHYRRQLVWQPLPGWRVTTVWVRPLFLAYFGSPPLPNPDKAAPAPPTGLPIALGRPAGQ